MRENENRCNSKAISMFISDLGIVTFNGMTINLEEKSLHSMRFHTDEVKRNVNIYIRGCKTRIFKTRTART